MHSSIPAHTESNFGGCVRLILRQGCPDRQLACPALPWSSRPPAGAGFGTGLPALGLTDILIFAPVPALSLPARLSREGQTVVERSNWLELPAAVGAGHTGSSPDGFNAGLRAARFTSPTWTPSVADVRHNGLSSNHSCAWRPINPFESTFALQPILAGKKPLGAGEHEHPLRGAFSTLAQLNSASRHTEQKNPHK